MTCGVAGRRQRPDAAARARSGWASLATNGRAERCGSSGRWLVAARVWV
jgi:hypothetical protein